MKPSAENPRRAAAARPLGPPSPGLPVIGRWQLVEPMGGDGTRVYRARPVDRPGNWPADYVVKLAVPLAAPLEADGAGSSLAVRLLQREAFVARQVSHPNLAPVLAAQVDAPPFFIVVPWLEGETLAGLLAEAKRLNVADVLWIARQAAEALAELHRCGWRHGDVKPANLLVAPSGHVTLIDLGFAQRLDATRPPASELSPATPAYAAPEYLCLTRPATARADVYSLGATLYETLAGRRPLPADDPLQFAVAHLQSAPADVRRSAPTVPRGVAHLVRRMLSKEPLRRPSSSELVEYLVRLEIESFDARDWAA